MVVASSAICCLALKRGIRRFILHVKHPTPFQAVSNIKRDYFSAPRQEHRLASTFSNACLKAREKASVCVIQQIIFSASKGEIIQIPI